MNIKITVALGALGVALAACNPLTPEAREMVGNYYNMELSQTEPVMELNGDGTCVLHAIRPGVLSYSVDGKWNVMRDTLFVETTGEPRDAVGDTTLIGEVARQINRPVVAFNGMTLTLNTGNAEYVLTRRKVSCDK